MKGSTGVASRGPPEWPREGSTGVASPRGVVERAAGDLRAVERAVGHLIADEGAAGPLDVVELDAGDLNAVLREVERAVGHLSADKSAAGHLDGSNVLPAIFVQTKRVACPLGGAMTATTFL